jgi:hypothetical protein
MLVTKKFVVLRQDGFDIGPIMIMEAEVDSNAIESVKDLVDEFKDGVTQWARKTEEGREIWEFAGTDTNIGDISEYLSDIIKYCPNINSMTAIMAEYNCGWNYDTPLCADIEEDVV